MFGIIRVRNLHAGDISSTEKHNFRLYKDKPSHVKKWKDREDEFKQPNIHDIYHNGEEGERRAGALKEALKARFEDVGIRPRKNSVIALEYVLAISPDASKDIARVYCYDAALTKLSQFIEEKHGEANVIARSFHFDESNPHVHVIVTPIREKEVKWKNKSGRGVKLENRLCARDYTGDKQLLRDLQSDFHQWCKSMPFAELTEHRFKRGMDARERAGLKLRPYENRTSAEIGKAREELTELKNELNNVRTLIQAEELERKIREQEEKINEKAKEEMLKVKKMAKKLFDKTTEKITEKSNEKSEGKKTKKRRFWKRNRGGGMGM